MAELAAHGPDIKVGTLDQEVERWREEAAPRAVTALDPAVWKEIPAQDNASYFAKFLVRVRETNDYLHATPALKVATQQRVAALLTQLQSDPALRDNCFNLAFDATETCGDRVALRLLDMEMACLASRTTAEIASGKYDRNPQPLVDLCKGQYRLQVLTRLAKEKVATLHFVDEIEVHLGYLVELAESHPLPTQVATMLYPACSCITSDDIAAAKSQLGNDGLSDIAAEKNNQDFQAFLAASPLMHSLLGRVREAEMTALNGDIQQQIAHEKNVIQDQLDHLDPASSGYGDECKQLMKQYNALDTVIPAGAIRSVLMPVLAQGGVNAGL
ncbi:invasion plasmid antigen [Oxalobacteraceae bacterium IMCC9480]|nr:invasion plasmid antigen [Oxalobacteraceae bacterium IMCC9480]NDP59652.1 invasion protein [Oxalobacteraceae bacterium]